MEEYTVNFLADVDVTIKAESPEEARKKAEKMFGEYHDKQFGYDGCEWGDAEFEFDATEQMKELALYPGEPEAYLYADTEGERLPIAGGIWNPGAGAGVFYLNLGSARSYSLSGIGFRSAFYGKLDSEV